MTTALTARTAITLMTLTALSVLAVGAGCAATHSTTAPADAPRVGSSSTTTPSTTQRASQPTAASTVEVVASGLATPWSVAFHDQTPLVSERDSGRIIALDPTGRPTEIAQVEIGSRAGEGGLLGIADHEGYLYAYATVGRENRITRYPIRGSGTQLSVGAAQTVLAGIPAGTYHNGGRIAFGPDGMLYATTGDAYADSAVAQDRNSLAGKILRITPDGKVPDDNPFPGSYVYSYGHRNPQGIAWADDGTMYATEFGQDTWDELNIIRAGGNYGWPAVEGIADNTNRGGDFIDPVQQWRPAEASPSGMTIHDGSIWVANLRGESIRQIPLTDTATSTRHYVGEYGRIRDLTVTPTGQLWAVTSNTDGTGQPGPDDDRILTIPTNYR